MKTWKEAIIPSTHTIIETMKVIDQTASQIAIVVNQEAQLLGTVTDGDIRRGILNGMTLDSNVVNIMNSNPTFVYVDTPKAKINKLFKNKSLRHIPVVNSEKKVMDIIFADEFFNRVQYDNTVILMAGGLGTRLRPLTNDIPKPLLSVGTKPILETIVESFIEYGFSNFLFSVNYKSEMIKSYFEDGTKWGATINYIDEATQLGTAGALSLLPSNPKKPFIVMNGDILTKVNFQRLIDFHEESNAMATMCVREYQYQIPYGVVRTDGQHLYSIEEKPTEKYFVNAGIYVLNPEVLDFVPYNQYYDMPSLFNELINKQYETSVFPIQEYWLDIGRMSDFEKANLEFNEVFK